MRSFGSSNPSCRMVRFRSTAETDLLQEEIIDSLGVFTLIGYLEQRFGVKIDASEVDLDNFRTVSRGAAVGGALAHDRDQILGGMDPFGLRWHDAPDTAAALLPPDAADRLTERIYRLRGSAPRSKSCRFPTSLSSVSTLPPHRSGAHAVILSVASIGRSMPPATNSPPPPTVIITAVCNEDGAASRSGSPHRRSNRRAATPTAPDPERFALRALRLDAELVRLSRTRGLRLSTPTGSWRSSAWSRPRSGPAPLLAGGFRGACRGDGARPRRHRVLRTPPIGRPNRRRRRLRCATSSNLPHLDRRVGQARLLEWHVAEGAEVGYGDPLVDIKPTSSPHSRFTVPPSTSPSWRDARWQPGPRPPG